MGEKSQSKSNLQFNGGPFQPRRMDTPFAGGVGQLHNPLPENIAAQMPWGGGSVSPQPMQDIRYPSHPSTNNVSSPTGAKVGGLKKSRIIIGAVIGIALLLGIVIFAIHLTSSIPGVTLYQVNARNVNTSIGGGGIVFPHQQLDISYPVPERVVSILVKAGDHVSANQSLIRLDPSQLNIQIKQASDEVAAAQAYLASVSASGSPVAIAQAQQQYNLAQSRYNALVAQDSSALLHNGNLISPMDGVVTSVYVNPDAVFAADTPLLTIMDEASVIVHVKIPLANLGQVRVGQQAVVTPSALPSLNLNGTVISIIPQADPQTDTFEVWVVVNNPDLKLLPGMSAFVRIQGSGQALVIPRMTVLDPTHESVTFVIHSGDDHVHAQRVHIIGRSIDAVYVNSGISRTDRVVVVGMNRLTDGEQVRVDKVESGIS